MIDYRDATQLPGWVIFLHKLARTGKATKVIGPSPGGTLTLARFDLAQPTKDKFSILADVDVAYLYYRGDR